MNGDVEKWLIALNFHLLHSKRRRDWLFSFSRFTFWALSCVSFWKGIRVPMVVTFLQGERNGSQRIQLHLLACLASFLVVHLLNLTSDEIDLRKHGLWKADWKPQNSIQRLPFYVEPYLQERHQASAPPLWLFGSLWPHQHPERWVVELRLNVWTSPQGQRKEEKWEGLSEDRRRVRSFWHKILRLGPL